MHDTSSSTLWLLSSLYRRQAKGATRSSGMVPAFVPRTITSSASHWFASVWGFSKPKSVNSWAGTSLSAKVSGASATDSQNSSWKFAVAMADSMSWVFRQSPEVGDDWTLLASIVPPSVMVVMYLTSRVASFAVSPSQVHMVKDTWFSKTLVLSTSQAIVPSGCGAAW